MAMKNDSPDIAWQEKMARKKKVVNELLALRRMKHMQQKNRQQSRPIHSPTTGRVYEAYNVVGNHDPFPNRITISREKVRDLMKGTTLEKELHDVYGDRAVDDAADHYVNLLSPDGYEDTDHRSGGREMDSVQRKLFLHNLLKDRKLKLEAKKEKRFMKEQALLQQKRSISLAKNKLRQDFQNENSGSAVVDDDSSDEDLRALVENVKQNINGIEKSLRALKQERKSQARSKKAPSKPPAIDYEFKPWQQEQVNIVSGIVQDIIAKTLDLCIYSGDDLGSSMLEALLQTDNEQWQHMMTQGMRHDGMIGIIDELIDEINVIIVQKVAEECAFLLKMTRALPADLVIDSAHTAQYGKPPKATNDARSQLIDQTWVEMVSRRSKSGKSLWRHTQSVVSAVSAPNQPLVPARVVAVDESEGDVVPITYDRRPLRNDCLDGEGWNRYVDLEFAYWKSTAVTLSSGPVSLSYRKIIGISCLVASGDNTLIALGTFRGDILVYDITWQPFRPIRCVSYASGRPPDRIVDMSWSLDRARLLTLCETFCVMVWSVSFPSPSSGNDIKRLDIPDSKDDKYQCQQLTAFVILEASQGDFTIKEGTLSASLSAGIFAIPKTARFSPVIDVTGAQNFIVVGFAGGDILKCDLSTRIKSRYKDLLHVALEEKFPPYISGENMIAKGNKMASEIDVELFRFHSHPVLLIHFTENNGHMVTMDDKFNIAQWKHSKDHLTGFGWFTPFKKFKLSGSELVMSPKGPERLVFEDEITLKKHTKGRKRKGKQVIEQERREVMMELRTLGIQNRKPWHSDDQELDDDDKKKKTGKFVTRTYSPAREEIVDPLGDQLFHIVTKQRSTNLVVKYSVQTYEVTNQQCKALIDFKPTCDGAKVFFMFLYEKKPPNRKAHITFVDLDLIRLDMMQSAVIKLEMDKDQYERCMTKRQAAFAISRKYLSTMSENIYCHVAGRMNVFSALTGSKVAWSAPEKRAKKLEEPDDDGLEFPQKLGNLANRLKVSVLCPDGDQTHVVMLTQPDEHRNEAVSGMFTLTDKSAPEARQALTFINRQLLGIDTSPVVEGGFRNEEDAPNNEQCVQNHKYTVRHMPTALYIRMVLNSLVDTAVAVVTGVRMTKEQRKALWQQDWKNMQNHFTHSGHENNPDT